MKRSIIFTQVLSLSLLLSCPHIHTDSAALSLAEIDQITDNSNNSYVYVTPEVIQNLKQLKALIQPDFCPQALAQITEAFDAQKCFLTRQIVESALKEAFSIVNHPDMPLENKAAIQECLEGYTQDIESGKALISIEVQTL